MEVDLGELPKNWRWIRLGEISERVSVGYVSSTRAYFCTPGEGVPLVRSQNIRPGRLILDDVAWVTREFHEANPKSQLRAGDVLITRVGANAGDVCIVPDGVGDMHLSSAVFARPAPEHRKYVELFFRSPLGQYVLKSKIVGSVSERINTRDVEALFVLLPTALEEDAIARILGTLDDKTDLNRRMSETLEATVRALFRSWFVDFDPVRAKVEGRQTGLPSHLHALFPDLFEKSEFGEIPAGWNVATLGELCRRIAMGPFGSNIKTDNFVAEGVPVIRGGNLSAGFVDQGFVFLTESKADELRNANAFPQDIVITHRGTLGQIGLIPRSCKYPRYVVSQSQLVLSVAPVRTTATYIYLYLTSLAGQHALLSNVSQTGVPAISRPVTNIRALRVISPPTSVLEAFSKIVEPTLERSVASTTESQALAAIRDALLPKLISGELLLQEIGPLQKTNT